MLDSDSRYLHPVAVTFESTPGTLLHPDAEVATKSGTLRPFGRGAPSEDPNEAFFARF